MASYREYDPEKASRARRIPTQAWEDMRTHIEELFIKEDRTLEEVGCIIAERHNFDAR